MEKIIKTQSVFNGHIIQVDVLTVKLPLGALAQREVVHAHAAAGVLAVVDGKALFVRQWRATVGQETLEIPAGKLDAQETALAAAKRELNEETGLAAGHWQQLSHYYQSLGFSDAEMTLFAASQLHSPTHKRVQDADESVAGEWLTFAQAKSAIQQGIICDAKTLLAIQYWQQMEGERDGGN
ncbi:NUDIX hydrolase [Lacticaseibacillus brantae]|nr:NUDIX hydrolase [Lacticaseibacillus brantae]